MDLCFFPGCNMPAIRPDVENAIRLTMPALGVNLVDLSGYVCCPAFGAFPATDKESQFATSGWNISLAEEQGHDILVQCGSCYSSLHMGLEHLHEDAALRAHINELLKPTGRSVNCTTKVRHVTDILYSEVGTEKIAAKIKHTLEGMHGVVQYPCHTLFPSEVVGFEKSPRRPVALRRLTEALGATVDTFSLEYQCCGGAGGFSKSSPAEADAFTKTKLDAIIKETKAEFIVVSCITCLMYLDNIQEKLNKQAGEEIYKIPVFDYNQLLALCMGFDGNKVAAISKISRDSILRRF
ncbi:MAG: CoB--CoM heterodisulfide reductase iron-sulfur subunit B family protein [Candidatus Electrothrix aestuarii]|uniref:CoB--CoM heterodisulfide reductase iron-sulfur subunit B family protein n=1 Tax=Candidatus Electrothrix aestuarii TaxID=3062594 RepID=A0AAU8LTB7_9BACT|nr:CoB--CoM heterodisulfide reductase iron-sulfur subunit B family protein [Candidatus Electrothrix aestuarii]